ncbi:G-type lectin S-receptor-like serine/threonine-protein kinase At4g27290 [Bidens hawaiensis]|uniref:G-type lectin S-receptor-like serine/threonine-protein kinase At4g27290 n=1 Tax=Bidens hawaiensis TaxID=980011 RepID=UPI00404A3DE0
MKGFSRHVLFFSAFILVQSNCAVPDTVYANQSIKDGETVVSEGKIFELGFFTPGDSKNRFLGIWYKAISKRTVVWVANRETPITETSGMFKVSSNGNLVIFSGDNNTVVWSSNSTVRGRGNNRVVFVQLLDTGNLVVWDKNKKSASQSVIWQSFDYPGDTMLAGMKIGKDLVTGLEWFMTSWKSPDDPSIGLYSDRVDTNGYPQVFGWQGEVIVSRFGPWNGIGYSGFPIDKENPLHFCDFIFNDKEIHYIFELKSSVFQRAVLTYDGKTQILQWIERIQDWIVYGDLKVDVCDRYELCGPYGICNIDKHPPCTCMQGFEPRNPEEWNASDWSSGCQRKRPLKCESGIGFRKISGVKLLDTRSSWYNHSMTLGECEITCEKNCSCTAYANLDLRNGGSGCLIWFGELRDTRKYDDDHGIYIRMAAFELVDYTESDFKKPKGILILVILTSSVVLLFVVAYASMTKKKRHVMKKKGNWEHLDDLPFFSLSEVARATGNFNVSNKIGEGGFGPVYKGVLDDGKEVAVKRLSETSLQGLEEFKNEVICIAKLQHRNLVKLLGYCIHGIEMILIYEYMSNKSLDSFLFDEVRSLILHWPKRFQIIHGIARGILYLHQDSRLQIIHRDIKAGNILLDSDMNPKISDFGLARKFVGPDTSAKTKKVVGTYGYISPEYAVHGRFSTKSNVYSFGVLLLEIVSGKKNREFSHENHGDNLLGHAWRLYKEGRSTELVSAPLRTSCTISEVLRSIHVGLLCVQNHAEDRPAMLSVVLMLVSDGALPEPKQPAFYDDESCPKFESLPSVDERTITLLYAR